MEPSTGEGGCGLRSEDGDESWEEREERELDVAYPKIRLRTLQNHLEVHTRQSRREASSSDGYEALERVHNMS